MELTLEMIAVVQWLMMVSGTSPRLERIEAYLIERYNRG